MRLSASEKLAPSETAFSYSSTAGTKASIIVLSPTFAPPRSCMTATAALSILPKTSLSIAAGVGTGLTHVDKEAPVEWAHGSADLGEQHLSKHVESLRRLARPATQPAKTTRIWGLNTLA